MGDISQRRGKVLDMNSEGHTQFINAEVPLANLHDYSTAIKSMITKIIANAKMEKPSKIIITGPPFDIKFRLFKFINSNKFIKIHRD